MATFTDDFTRSDRDLHSDGGWVVLSETDNTTGVLEIRDGQVTTTAGTSPAIAVQTGTAPTTFKQDVGAIVTATLEHANSYVDVGVGYAATGADLTEHPRTFAARFRWLPNGARRLELVSRLLGDAEVIHKAIDLATAGGVVAARAEGFLAEAGALGVPQLVWLKVERVNAGALVQIGLGTRDLSQPILSAVVSHGYVPPNSAAQTTPGSTFLFFGANSSAATLFASWMGFSDTAEAEIPLGAPEGTQGTMRYLSGLVRMRLGRGSSSGQTNLDPEVIRQDLRDAVEYIMLMVGDAPYWAVREEELTLTFAADGTATLPAYVQRVQAVLRSGLTREPLYWKYVRHTTDGLVVIWMPPGTAPSGFVVRYLVNHSAFFEDDDVCPIPRRHQELVVVEAALRSAEREQRFIETRNSLLARARDLRTQVMRDIGRHMNQARDQYAPVRYVDSRRFGVRGGGVWP